MSDVNDWGEAGMKYTIHPETLSFFQKTKTLGFRSYLEASLEEYRAAALRIGELFAGHTNFTGSDIEYIVPCEGNEAGVPVSVYKPADVSRVPAIWIYFHGGGLVIGSRNLFQPALTKLASLARCIIVNVEYRLAPEHKAPAAFDDCRAVAHWVLQNKTLIGGDRESQVGIGGNSAGGQLTASVTQDVKGLAFQILIHPVTDLSLTTASCAEFYDTPGLNAKRMEWLIQLFLVSEDQRKDPVVCPCLRPSFKGLPPALVIIAELDPLRDDGLAYAEKLKEAGVPTELLLVKGAAHGGFHLPGYFTQITQEIYDCIVEFLIRFQKD